MAPRPAATSTRLFSPAIEASLLMVFVCACFAGMSALIRDLSSEISPFEIAFFRNAIGLLLLVPVMWRIGFEFPPAPALKAYGIRAVIGICAMWAWYSALSFTPLAEAITLNFTVALWMIPVAILLLGEKVGMRRWAATIVGFYGVLIVMQPGAQTVGLGSLLAIFSALMFAISMSLVRLLTRTQRPIAIVFYMNLLMTPLSRPGDRLLDDAGFEPMGLADCDRLPGDDCPFRHGPRLVAGRGLFGHTARFHPPALRRLDRLFCLWRSAERMDLARRGADRGQRHLYSTARSQIAAQRGNTGRNSGLIGFYSPASAM